MICAVADSFNNDPQNEAMGLLGQAGPWSIDLTFAIPGRSLYQVENDLQSSGKSIETAFLLRGINDIAGGTSTDVATFMGHVEDSLNAIFAAGADKIFFGTVAPFASVNSPGYAPIKQTLIANVNALILAKSFSNVLANRIADICICDVNAILDADGDGFLDTSYKNGEDDIHPNLIGSQAMADEFYAKMQTVYDC
jgi:lysophospholipase L1-like esterase